MICVPCTLLTWVLLNRGLTMDRLSRLTEHLLLQRRWVNPPISRTFSWKCLGTLWRYLCYSFYPLYPPTKDVNMQCDMLVEHTRIPVTPHILITPSDLRAFAKVQHYTSNSYQCGGSINRKSCLVFRTFADVVVWIRVVWWKERRVDLTQESSFVFRTWATPTRHLCSTPPHKSFEYKHLRTSPSNINISAQVLRIWTIHCVNPNTTAKY